MSTRTSPPPSSVDRQFVTVDQVAAQFHVTTRTVRRWIASGELPAYRVGGHLIRIRLRDVDALALNHPIVGA